MMPKLRTGLLLAWLVLLTLPAFGQATAERRSSEVATAEALYQEGRTLFGAGQIERACSVLEASQRVDPAVGTLLLLAHCYETLGKTASAWALFREAQSLSLDRPARSEIARQRADALEPKLARLTLMIDPEALQSLKRNQITFDDLQIERDDAPVPSASLGVPIPVDPGVHAVRVTGAKLALWTDVVSIPQGPSSSVLVITGLRVLAPHPVVVSSELLQGPAERRSSVRATGERLQRAESTDLSPLPYLGAGAGALGLVLGGGLAWAAQSSYSESLEHCRTPGLCDETGLKLRAQAYDRAEWATWSSSLGAALLAAGVVWIVWESPQSEGIELRPEGDARTAGIVISGQL